MAIEKLLVPIDKSDLNYKVLHTAFAIADRFDAHVTVLRIGNKPASLDMEDEQQTASDLDAIELETKRVIAEAMSRLNGGHTIRADQVTAEVRVGPVVDTICATADELLSDIIVMGTHGREGLADFFTGSTTERVVNRTPVSVMVIKPSGFPYLRD